MRYFYHERDNDGFIAEHYVCVDDTLPKATNRRNSKYKEIYVKQAHQDRFYRQKWTADCNGYRHTAKHKEITKEEYEEGIFIDSL